MKWTVKVRPDIWTDPRTRYLEKTLGSRYEAIGRLVEFWGEAQSYWANDERMPKKIFELIDGRIFIEAGFAEEVSDGIRAKGDHEHFAWLKSQRERSAKGHEKRYGNKKNSAPSMPQACPKHAPAMPQTAHELEQELELEQEQNKNTSLTGSAKTHVFAPHADANAKKIFDGDSEIPETEAEISVDFSGEKSLPVSSTETHQESTKEPPLVSQGRLDLKSTSFDEQPVKSDLPDTNRILAPTKKRKRADVSPEESAARSEARAAYVEAFQARYSTKPIIAAKENTQIKNLVSSVGQQDAPFLVKFYLECSDEFLVNKCHPIGVLAANPTEYMVRWKKGQTNRPSPRFGFPSKRPDARYVHQCLPEPDDGDTMLPWEREEFEAKKLEKETAQ